MKPEMIRHVLSAFTLLSVLLTASAPTAAQAPQDAAVPMRLSALHQGPSTAPVTMVVFSDFECPVCARVPAMLKELASTHAGAVRIVFKHNPLPNHGKAPLAHEAALAAGAQGKFWEMHDLIFANQPRLELEDLTGYARQLGLNMVEFTKALEQRQYQALVDADAIEARAMGITSTPTFFVNGRRVNGLPTLSVMRATVDVALGLTPTLTVAAPEFGEGELDFSKSPVKGPADAPVTIVEFSDLECPFCRTVLPTVRELMDLYPNKVRWVFKHNPLNFHRNAQLAHQAALAAGEQGKFWEMHDLVFANQREMSREHLFAHARTLELDMVRFENDIDREDFKSSIQADLEEGRKLGVPGTPMFFINGRRVSGAKPLQEFRALVELALKEASTETAAATPPPNVSGLESALTFAKGPADAPVELVWFTDMRSPLTPKAAELIDRVMRKYPSQVKVTIRHRPVDLRPDAKLAHEAALAAGAQGKFWEMHDLIVSKGAAVTRDVLQTYASQLGLDVQRFGSELADGKYKPIIERDLAEAQRRDVRGTPVFFVQSQRIDGLQPLTMFDKAISDAMEKKGGTR